MKFFRNSLLTALLLAATASFAADATKIATVDVDKLFNGYYKTKLAQASLDSRKAELEKEVKDMDSDIKKAQADYKQLLDLANDQAISTEEREKRKQAAADKLKDVNSNRAALEQFRNQATTQLSDQMTRMSTSVLAEVQKYVAEEAKAKGFSVVLNVNFSKSVVYASPETDITAAVMTRMNAGAPTDLSLPTTSSTLSISTNAP